MLIADSDPNVRQQLYSALLAADVFSDCVSDAADALRKLDEETYGVVLLDIGLPGDAENVVDAIARRPAGERPVVLVVASNPVTARQLDVEVVQIVLRKPLALRQTVDVIRSCVENSGPRPAVRESGGNGDHLIS